MSNKFHLIELCCGSAALTLHLIGARRQLMAYQGSKWKFRHELKKLLVERGHTELAGITLNDTGPWGATWRNIRMNLPGVIKTLHEFEAEDPLEVYNRLNKNLASNKIFPEFAAEFLFLQRLAFSGKAVGLKDSLPDEGRQVWSSPGFNRTSAYGTAKTDRFGGINPMIPSLIASLKKFQKLPTPAHWVCTQDSACDAKTYWNGAHPVVYLDPNYQGSTGYPNGAMSRAEVIETAKRWHRDHQATVLVSEAEPIYDLMEEGWEQRQIRKTSSDKKPFQTKAQEWVTMSPLRN